MRCVSRLAVPLLGPPHFIVQPHGLYEPSVCASSTKHSMLCPFALTGVKRFRKLHTGEGCCPERTGGGERYSRFVGSLLDAPGFSRFLVFFVALGICQRFKNLSFHGDKKFSTLIILLLLILTQFLTLGRAGILISISSLFVIITLQKRYRYFGLFGMIFLVLSLIPFASIDVGNFFRHLIGLQAGFSNMTMFGHGMGSGGQQIANYAAETASSIEVRESFLGAWVFQTGYYGFFTYITLVVCLVVYLFRLNINKIHQKSRAIYISSLLCVLFAFLSSIFANSAMSFYSLMLPLIFLGATVGCYKNVK